jgi:hypothetical protein
MKVNAVFVWGLLVSLVACAARPAPSGASAPTERDVIAKVHASKCGSCHTPPDPDTRTREHVEDALSRHRKRVRLTGEEWAMMVDYLAMPDGKTARQPSSVASASQRSASAGLDRGR